MKRSGWILTTILVLAVALIVGCAPHLMKQTVEVQEEYAVVKTKYTAIKFQPSQLSEIKRCLEVRDLAEVDILYEKVFYFLKRFRGDKNTVLTPVKIGVTVYSSWRRAEKVYKNYGGKEARMEAFYEPNLGEAYFSLWHLNWKNLVHEFAHHQIRKEFRLNLPEKEEEALAIRVGEFLEGLF